MRDAGHAVAAPDLPCDDLGAGLDQYAETALAALGPEPSADLVVVGHSLGALVAPLVASRLPTRRMIMVAGIVGAPGVSLESLAAEDAERDLPLGDDGIEMDEAGRFRFSAAGARRLLYHDCDPQTAAAAIPRLRFQRSLWTQVADFAAWPDTEIMSIICSDDRLVDPSWSQRTARRRLGVEPVYLPGGHSPFLSRPDHLASVMAAGL